MIDKIYVINHSDKKLLHNCIISAMRSHTLHAVVTGKNAASYTFLLSVVSPASIHDLRILEENISETKAPVVMGDKTYISKKLQKHMPISKVHVR